MGASIALRIHLGQECPVSTECDRDRRKVGCPDVSLAAYCPVELKTVHQLNRAFQRIFVTAATSQRPSKGHSSNIGTWRWSSAPRCLRRVAPITASTVSDSSAVRGTKIRCVFERWSGGLTRNPSGVVCVRSAGIRPSSTSLSLNRSRTHSPSDRGRDVNVLRVSDSESPNSRTKYTPLISRRSIEITVPEVFNSSSLPSLTNCAGDT